MGHPVVRCWDCVRLLLFLIREKSHDASQRRRCCTNETLGSSRNDSLRIVAALERRKRGLQCPSQGSYVEGLRLSCGESWECFFYHEIRHPNKANGLGLVARVKPLVARVKLLVARVELLVARVKPRQLQLRSSCDRNSGKPLKILHFSWDLNATNPYLQGVSLENKPELQQESGKILAHSNIFLNSWCNLLLIVRVILSCKETLATKVFTLVTKELVKKN